MRPSSVEGGPTRSGFCWSRTSLSGAMMFAPVFPRIGSTVSVVSCGQSGKFEASEAGETVKYSGVGMTGVGLLVFELSNEELAEAEK